MFHAQIAVGAPKRAIIVASFPKASMVPPSGHLSAHKRAKDLPSSASILGLDTQDFSAHKRAKDAAPRVFTLKQLVRLVMPSMVRLTVLNKDGVPAVQGSGFVVGPNLIATNYHVVRGAHAVTPNSET